MGPVLGIGIATSTSNPSPSPSPSPNPSQTLFAVAAFALGAYYSWHDDANTSRVRRWMPLTCTALQGANWFVTSMCWFKPWLPPIAQIAPLWDNDWRALPP